MAAVWAVRENLLTPFDKLRVSGLEECHAERPLLSFRGVPTGLDDEESGAWVG